MEEEGDELRWKLIDSHVSNLLLSLLLPAGATVLVLVLVLAGAGRENIPLSVSSGVM
jgi:hypothetical protein